MRKVTIGIFLGSYLSFKFFQSFFYNIYIYIYNFFIYQRIFIIFTDFKSLSKKDLDLGSSLYV